MLMLMFNAITNANASNNTNANADCNFKLILFDLK
jgi:hypothetical protein